MPSCRPTVLSSSGVGSFALAMGIPPPAVTLLRGRAPILASGSTGERFDEPPVALQRVAELLVSRRVMRAREQERVAVVGGARRPVLHQAEPDLLVVRV